MFRRIMMVGVLGVSLVAALGSEAQAHLQGYQVINGYVRHVSSFDCGIQIRQLPGSLLNEGRVLYECFANITAVFTLCGVPGNLNDPTPGEAATNVFGFGATELNDADITDKKKGKAEKAVLIDENTLFPIGQQNTGLCVNDNWWLLDVLTRDVTVTLKTFECTGPDSDPCGRSEDKILAYVEELDCVIPPGFDIVNPPPPGTDYQCVLKFKLHQN